MTGPQRPIRACPVCRYAEGVELLHTQEFILSEEHLLPDRQDLVACCECGFVYADEPASQRIFDEYYATTSKYEMDYTGDDVAMFAARAAWIRKVLADNGSSIIDVGCGNGRLLLELRDAGFDGLSALDPSERCINAIQAQGIEGFVGSLFCPPMERTFDALVLSGVLEHIWDVPGAMRAVRSLLDEGGHLFVFVPDAARYADFDLAPYDYFNVEHVNHFDEVSLVNLGLLHGFEVVEVCKSEILVGDVRQPVIHCAYRLSHSGESTLTTHAADAVRRYVEQTGRRGDAGIIEDLLYTGAPVAVWGAGNYASRLLATTDLKRCNVVCFVDRDPHKQGTCVAGRPVVSPERLLGLGQDVRILVVAAVFREEIVAEAKAMGLKNEVIVAGER